MSTRRSARLSSASANGDTEASRTAEGASPAVDVNSKSSSKREAPSKPRKSSKKAPEPASAIDQNGAPEFAVPELPQTPRNKRRKTEDEASLAKAPPFTPTPSAIGFMTSSSPAPPAKSTSTSIFGPDPVVHPRPAEPHITNAILSTPGGSKVAAYSEDDHVLEEGPSATAVPVPTTTTNNILEEACKHLCAVDPSLQKVIDKFHCRIFSPEGLQEKVDPFNSLTSSIMAQQVSGAAARSIKNKFIALFSDNGSFPTPAQVAATDIATLRSAGLSQRKAEYIKGLAEKFESGELTAQMLVQASDEEVLERLVAVRGLGRWSVEMFSCFSLKRMDIFSTGDLGVQRGMAAWQGKDVSKLKAKGGKWKYMSEADMLMHSAKFAPYRSLFMWYMWRMEDVNVEALQGD